MYHLYPSDPDVAEGNFKDVKDMQLDCISH